MMREYPIALIDTNVWLDSCLCSRPKSDQSRAFLREARARGVQLTYALHCLNDFFFLVQAHLRREARRSGELSESEALAINAAAWACVDALRESACAIGADESDAWRACKYRKLTNDLEDNLLIAAAERVPVDFIVTNDEQLLRRATVKAYTPEDATLVLQTTRPLERS